MCITMRPLDTDHLLLMVYLCAKKMVSVGLLHILRITLG